MTTWYSHWPLSHPWMPSLKRHRSDSPDLDSGCDLSLGPQSYAPHSSSPQAKRPRYDLARNLSQLSLLEQVSNPPKDAVINQDVTLSSLSPTPLLDASAHMIMDADGDISILDVVRPIIEEPTSIRPSLPDVHMHQTSSYEPEKDRIVITDLDSSEDEAETPADTPAGGHPPYSVSSAFLSRIKGSKVLAPLIKPATPDSELDPSRALVLFTPSPWSAKDPRELEGIYRVRDNDRRRPIVSEAPEADPDAMEVE